jgi:parvulin-like peptidyl-prolyl isomerase
MDPLTAVGLGANILQFVQIAAKLVGAAKDIHHSVEGATAENVDLETVTETIQSRYERLQQTVAQRNLNVDPNAVPETDKDLAKLLPNCDAVAHQLLEALEKLKLKYPKRKWITTLQAFRTIWSANEIQTLRERLERYESSIQTALLVCLK